LFVGVSIAPSANVVVAKEAIRKKYIDSINESKKLSKNNLVVLTQQDAKELKKLFNSINEKLINSNMREPPFIIWLILLIIGILIYSIELIKEGKLLSEIFRGFCFILLIIVGQVSMIIVNFHRMFIDYFWPWGRLKFEDTILGHIYLWLLNIVWPDIPWRCSEFHLFVKNNISIWIPIDEG
jgi:hypothetical protein